MRILYDGHIFRWQQVGGIRRYFGEVIARLPGDWEVAIIGAQAKRDSLPARQHLQVSPESSIRPRRFSQPLKERWWKSHYGCKADILHPTYYSLSGGLRLSDFRCPKVMTVYDLIGASYPQLEDDSENTIRIQREAFAQADYFICISKYTEQDLLDRHPELAGRTTVIHLGTSFPISGGLPPADLFEQPTFLVVGNRGTYKNFLFLLRAFAKACETHPRLRLRVAGQPLEMEEKWQIHFLGIADRIDQSILPSESELQELYRHSVALLYPSRHEGFGIPPLEAMACGTLAITSDRTSLPEVVGDAGIMLDPTDESAWVSCILEVAKGGGERAHFLEKGRQRAATLSWHQTAERHVEIYRRLAIT